jgi:hypothetical protein
LHEIQTETAIAVSVKKDIKQKRVRRFLLRKNPAKSYLFDKENG